MKNEHLLQIILVLIITVFSIAGCGSYGGSKDNSKNDDEIIYDSNESEIMGDDGEVGPMYCDDAYSEEYNSNSFNVDSDYINETEYVDNEDGERYQNMDDGTVLILDENELPLLCN